MALHVRVAACLFSKPAQSALDRAMWSGPGSPYLQQRGWNGCVTRDCSHKSPSLPLRRAHVERGPASDVALSLKVVAILHCAVCPILSAIYAWPSRTCQCQVRPR